MNIKIDMSLQKGLCLCPYCLGTGKLKAMQNAMTYDAGTIRYKDTLVKCNHCNGTGLLK
ncbi:hypothetical protein SAMN05446037_100281 [Anaerovirgula multivorans]|uniref:Uncharacterized protein n=1 Tax=Anaerovirgula multivorans TaxID=312168 RepID=A0A239AL33_9FIRM|nr:hypothetical protein [Anaerovirgula multivorans]SNR95708.1 hypothetical protein SAMN05446037_100281 [Anaerovirgula multivorans]